MNAKELAELENARARAMSDAVEDACLIAWINFDPDDPRKTLWDLISWHTSIALDISVSSDARELVDRGYYKGVLHTLGWVLSLSAATWAMLEIFFW